MEKPMHLLIADDDAASRRILEAMLIKWGYAVTAVADGDAAWTALLARPDEAQLAILDWIMPGMDGVEVCRRYREAFPSNPCYLILLTAKDQKKDIVAGLAAGADDYIAKPFDMEELRARIRVGERMVNLQKALAGRVRELEASQAHVKALQGILPICSYCKKIRNDQNYWQQVESYIAQHSEVAFSHGICPECYERHIKPITEAHHHHHHHHGEDR